MDNEITTESESTATTPGEFAIKTAATLAVVTIGVLVVGRVKAFRNRDKTETPTIDTTEE